MELKTLDGEFSVCKLSSLEGIDLTDNFSFLAKTDEELSLVCSTASVPVSVTVQDDGWRGLRIQGVLDFSLIGILAKLSTVLAEQEIGLFAVSTYNTDYIFIKQESFDRALQALAEAGYTIH